MYSFVETKGSYKCVWCITIKGLLTFLCGKNSIREVFCSRGWCSFVVQEVPRFGLAWFFFNKVALEVKFRSIITNAIVIYPSSMPTWDVVFKATPCTLHLSLWWFGKRNVMQKTFHYKNKTFSLSARNTKIWFLSCHISALLLYIHEFNNNFAWLLTWKQAFHNRVFTEKKCTIFS